MSELWRGGPDNMYMQVSQGLEWRLLQQYVPMLSVAMMIMMNIVYFRHIKQVQFTYIAP